MAEETSTSQGAQDKTQEITQLLAEWRQGDEQALALLMPIVYQHLQKIAHAQMRRERAVTLQPTALVHEAFLRLVRVDVDWQDRTHFFALASSMMRRVLVDEAKRRHALKRGGNETLLLIEQLDIRQEAPRAAELLALDAALTELGKLDERKMRVVELRFFAGLTIEECAQVLKIGHATVERDLKMARVWLANQIGIDPGALG